MRSFATYALFLAILGAIAASAQADINTWALSGSTKIDSGTPCVDGTGYNSGDTIDFIDNGGGSLNNNPGDGSFAGSYGGGDLQNAYLYQWDLTHVNFALSNLSNSYIAGANLSGAYLSGGATFDGSDFTGANLTGTTLSEINDNYADVGSSYRSCTFRNANLSGAKLESADLTGADFTGANLKYASLAGAAVPGVDFTGQDLTGTSLVGVNLSGVSLTNATIAGADFGDSTLTYSQLTTTASFAAKDLHGVGLWGINLTGANFRGFNLSGSTTSFGMAILTNADLRDTNLAGAYFGRATMTGVNLANAVVTGANFATLGAIPGINFGQLSSTASYTAKNLSRMNFVNLNMSTWNFAGQYLVETRFSADASTACNIAGANFSDADLRNAVYKAASLATATTTNAILTDGKINGLSLASGETLVVRNYIPTYPPNLARAIHVVGLSPTFAAGSTLKTVYDGNAWGSTVSFDSGASVNVAGTLQLSVDPNLSIYSLVGTHTMNLFNWAGTTRTGTFALTSSGVGLGCWDVSNLYTTGAVSLTILEGDANLDGTVNINDLSKLLANYDKTGLQWADGDFDNNGTVDISDLSKVLANYDKSVGMSASGIRAVPEPGTLALLAVALLGALVCIRRRRN
jgi:uncharacterized protein YjbI with pentapeptide repeats